MDTTTLTSQSYLTFRLADELFAANVSKVLPILELPKITKIPRAPAKLRGVINQRATELPDIARSKNGVAGADVGAGKALSVVVPRFGPVVLKSRSRKDPDTSDTAHWMLDICEQEKIGRLNFDSVGVGAGVVSTLKKAVRKFKIERYAINTGVEPTSREWPDERTSKERFGNLKAELCWLAREAIKRSHEYWLWLHKQDGGFNHKLDEIIVLDPEDATLAAQLSLVKWGRNEKGKIVIESKEALKKRSIPSPDYFDAFVLTFVDDDEGDISGIRFDTGDMDRGNRFRIGN